MPGVGVEPTTEYGPNSVILHSRAYILMSIPITPLPNGPSFSPSPVLILMISGKISFITSIISYFKFLISCHLSQSSVGVITYLQLIKLLGLFLKFWNIPDPDFNPLNRNQRTLSPQLSNFIIDCIRPELVEFSLI